VGQAGLRREESAVEMDGEHLFPLGKWEILDGMDDLDTGVRDEDIDGSEGRNRLRDALVHRVLVRHIHRDCNGFIGSAELACGFLRLIAIYVGNGDPAACSDIPLRDAVADSARRSRYDCGFSIEFHVELPPLRGVGHLIKRQGEIS